MILSNYSSLYVFFSLEFSHFLQVLNYDWILHENIVSVSATSSLWKKINFINDSLRWLLSFCVSLPNEFWELCAVVITTRYQLGNLYANGIGLGLISSPIPQDLVAMGMPNSSLSNFFSSLFGGKRTAAFLWQDYTVTSPQVLRKEPVSVSEEV